MMTNPRPANQTNVGRIQGLWRMTEGYRLSYFLASVSLTVAASARAYTSLVLRQFVDGVVQQGSVRRQLSRVALVFVGLAVVEGVFSFLSGWFAALTAEGITLRLRNQLLDHIQRLPFAYHNKTATGELISRSTSDVDALRRFYADQAIGITRIVVLFLVNVGVLVRLNHTLALVAITLIPAVVFVSIVFFRRISQAYEAYQEQEATLATVLQENLSGVRVVKAFARQDHEREKFERTNIEKYRRGHRLVTMHALFWPISDLMCGVQMVIGFLAGAKLAMSGEISIGTYVAYASLIVWVVWPMRNLGRLIVQLSSGLVSLGRVTEILGEQREEIDEGLAPDPQCIRGAVAFHDVSFTYADGTQALAGINLDIPEGKVVALVGSTGSGKTTLVSLLPRFYDPSSGSVTLDGIDLREYSTRCLRQQIGIVEQEPFLFSRSIRDNIALGIDRPVSQADIEGVARVAALHDEILAFPQAYDTLVGEKGVTLSGGQKQRVAIARTLLKNPRILILDDSTSSVDVDTEECIRQSLETLMRGRTAFVIAHRLQSLERADVVVVLDRGRIVQQGTHSELLQQHGFYQTVHDIQSRVEAELGEETGDG
jgi:ATP-binding cassette, subfamily B, bacterial